MYKVYYTYLLYKYIIYYKKLGVKQNKTKITSYWIRFVHFNHDCFGVSAPERRELENNPFADVR